MFDFFLNVFLSLYLCCFLYDFSFPLIFNSVCPLTFPSTNHVVKSCGNGMNDHRACCNAVENFVSHLQNQSFVTNLQALNCAATLGLKLQKANITKNIYNLCHISLKDFSVQGQFSFIFYHFKYKIINSLS